MPKHCVRVEAGGSEGRGGGANGNHNTMMENTEHGGQRACQQNAGLSLVRARTKAENCHCDHACTLRCTVYCKQR